ncbi:biotin--[acetyl-CoA-carboxylase] ligase [Clostridium uliginosum]|uniref:Bifunctional ligase/repressor BirA n=1 Tax=Clostridium uliginosum TaxID=119641 RepID=A0A1I1K992_9CLOT|nr:biotin--[acetyl-CoA-carboxylase] ligase [Clostridium uliginosum]SFC57105.1 BirA family transcriptional regulator, biotin operon repressor / biotin-[acetyl-CoA-carboxylase] ligase [Clostridium uliginosum]
MELKILNKLKNSSGYISGELLSSHLNISRSAIWKHIKSLKDKGYIIEGVSKKGYKLISSPDLLNPVEIIPLLKTTEIGKDIKYFNELTSTNDKAKELGKSDVQSGTLVIAEKQTLGKGRFDRQWISPNGGIWFTLILRPDIPPTEASKITQIAAASIYKALLELDIKVNIKWPNDIFLNGKKICGILTEMKCDMDRIHYLIVGVGINANIESNDIPNELKEIATSLKIELKQNFKRTEILANFLNHFEQLYNKFILNIDISEVISICRANSNIINNKAKLVTYNKEEIVTCVSLTDNGELVVKDADGKEKIITSGEISFRI